MLKSSTANIGIIFVSRRIPIHGWFTSSRRQVVSRTIKHMRSGLSVMWGVEGQPVRMRANLKA